MTALVLGTITEGDVVVYKGTHPLLQKQWTGCYSIYQISRGWVNGRHIVSSSVIGYWQWTEGWTGASIEDVEMCYADLLIAE
jgi:hypothetical protein